MLMRIEQCPRHLTLVALMLLARCAGMWPRWFDTGLPSPKRRTTVLVASVAFEAPITHASDIYSFDDVPSACSNYCRCGPRFSHPSGQLPSHLIDIRFFSRRELKPFSSHFTVDRIAIDQLIVIEIVLGDLETLPLPCEVMRVQ